jgi:nucleotide-binding universal stress UspA family protein
LEISGITMTDALPIASPRRRWTMAKLFKKILCPIDFDDNSLAALDYARDLALESHATLYVMNVIFLPLAAPGFPLEPGPVVSEEPSRRAVEKVAREHLHGKVHYELLIRTGKPAELINQTAEELDVDLIVMATHGRKGVNHFFLGSVAEHVVRGAKRPVLTIRPGL